MKALQALRSKPFPQPEVILLRQPVLMCHGFGALGNFTSKGLLHETCMMLRTRGVLAFAPNILPYGKIETRAEGWCEAIDQILEITGAEKLHVIAHSMGGLDMRYAISTLGRHAQISTLTTVSSPHRGTTLAGLTLNTPDAIRQSLEDITNWFGNNVYPKIPSDVAGALEQLDPDYVMDVFNPANPDHPNVKYRSVTATCGKGTDTGINRLLIPFNNYIYEREGANDGYVAEASAEWGEVILRTRLSHPEQIRLNLPAKKRPVWEKFWTDILKELES
jgi:triacylglycerol lipase